MEYPATDPRAGRKWPEGKSDHLPATGLGPTPKIPIWEKWNTQRLTLGLVNNGDSPKLTTQRLTLGLPKNALEANLGTPCD